MFTKFQSLIWAYALISWCSLVVWLPTGSEAATEYNRYLAHIFNKYGTGGTMTFEGLEHLMYNLGLGQIEIEHSLEEHHPKATHSKSASTEKLRTYFEQQTGNFLANEQDFIYASNEPRAGANAEDTQMQAAQETTGTAEPPHDEGFILEFKEMHDPRHRHPRQNEHSGDPMEHLSANVCLSPKALLISVINHNDLHTRKFYKTFASPSMQPFKFANTEAHNVEEEYNTFVNKVRLTPADFLKLCPVLLSQVDQQVCARPAPLRHAEDPKDALWSAWVYASASIFILSACGLVGILLVPLMKTKIYQEILKFLVSIAVGTLSGDALMHLLPHALSTSNSEESAHEASDSAGHGHDNTPVWICSCAFAAAVFMYILENLVPLLKKSNGGHSHHGHSHGHSQGGGHSHGAPPPKAQETQVRESNTMLNELKEDKKMEAPPLSPAAFMVILGDGLHNLTDGLAIGAAFAADPVTGVATAFAVLCHELPHELGDLALLLQVGMPIRRAIYLNIVSSVLSFLGMAVGLFVSTLHTNMTQWIYAATSGSFLYIAFADLMPAMGASSGQATVRDVLIQIVGFLAGGIIMLLIAVNEDYIEALFK